MDLTSIPNNISGDGRMFVAQLKKYLGVSVEDNSALVDENDTSSYCQTLSWVNLTQEQQAGVNRIRVSWDKSSVYGFESATVFYKSVSSNLFTIAGSSEDNEFVIDNVQIGRYAVKVVPKNIDGGYDKSPATYYIDVVASMTTPNPPQQFVVTFESGEGHWSWKYDEVYDYFELRTDTNVGVANEHLLARTNRKEVVKEPTITNGTAYLYVRNSFGIYSAPAVHQFDISSLGIPPRPTISRGYNGVNIHMTDKGDNDYYVVQIEENIYDNISNNPFYIERTRGAMRVRYCYSKDGSRKVWSNWAIFNISELIDTENLADNCITADKISSGAVTTSKLFAGNIELAGALAIVGGAVTLNENGLRCSALNGDSVIVDNQGLRFVDSNDNEFSAIKRVVMGEAEHDRTITFTKPFIGSPKIVCNPKEIQVGEANYSQSNVVMVCKPVNVSNTGFTMQCYTQLGAGSSNIQNIGVTVEPSTYVGERKFYGYDNMYYGYTDYVYTAQEAASEVAFRFSLTTYAPMMSVGNDDYTQYYANWGFGVIEIYIDGVQVWTSGDVGYVNSEERKTTIITTDSFKIPNSRQITIKLWKAYYRAWSASKATFFIDWAKSNVNAPTIISTGTASFIAVDTGEYYT